MDRTYRESAAIIAYLVDKYDLEHKISVSDANEKYHQLQWLFFQASGQGYDPSTSSPSVADVKQTILRPGELVLAVYT